MIASLGMYGAGPVDAATDRFWVLIRDGLRARGLRAPDALVRGDAAYWPAWTAADLVVSQTCGYPFRARLLDQVTYVGTLDYGVESCPPGHYRSVYVARRDDPRQTLTDFDHAPFAYNEPLSQSGWAAPQTHAAALGIHLPPVLKSGGHRLSAIAVAEGRADLAALDAVTWALLQDHDPVAAALRTVGHTPPSPGLPCITAKANDPAPIFAAMDDAIAALTTTDRATLHLRGIVRIPVADYLAVPNPPSPDQFVQPA